MWANDISVQPGDLYQYSYEELCIGIEQVKRSKFSLCYARGLHYKELLMTKRREGSDYTVGMMTVFMSNNVK